jgi:hypothetical protein
VPAAATVEGTPIHGMPIAFAGCRRNAGLGRSVSVVWGSFPGNRSHRRQQVSSGRMRRGTSSACARRTHSSRQTPKKRLHEMRTRPSLGPETRARQSALNSHGASRGRCRGGRDIAVGQTCASRRNRHRGHGHTDECAARRPSPLLGQPRGSCVMRKKRKVVMAIVPARKTRVPDLSSVRRKQLQKSAGSILASNKHARSAPKRVTVRVNGGLGGAVTGTRVSAATSIEEMIW